MKLDELSGEVLAHFRIEHRLGAGGMGIVYRAEDVVAGRRDVGQPMWMLDPP